MAGGKGPGQERTGVRFEAPCAWCGPVEFRSGSLQVHVGSGPDALAAFVCPSCGKENFRELSSGDVSALTAAGVVTSGAPAPFELLERRPGPAIGWDDLIDFHEALARTDPPTTPDTSEGPRPRHERKRDAA
jgi:hypothetical protein